jgi:hypothetical protein
MILTREIEITINESNSSYYEELGYEVYFGETIIIPVELLSYGSQIKILCRCDGCQITKEVMFKNYVKYGNRWGEYYCRKCSEVKRKATLKENYGVDYPIQNIALMKRMKETMQKNWGVDFASLNMRKNPEMKKQKGKSE